MADAIQAVSRGSAGRQDSIVRTEMGLRKHGGFPS